MTQIYITPTNARQNFFNILKQVDEGKTEFIIKGKNLSQNIILSKKTKTKPKKQDDFDVMKLYGSLKSDVPYNPNEKKIAREMMAKDYAKKYQ